MSHSPSPSNDSTTPIGEATTNQTVRAQANQNEQVQQTATPVQNANGTENATMLTEEDVMNAKLTSVVWKDFKRIRVDGMLKAKCNYCNKLLGGGSNHDSDQRYCAYRFIYVPAPHTSERLASVLVECMLAWNVDNKVSTVTLDNCSTNDAMLKKVRTSETKMKLRVVL
ncbi:hypothetical protein LINPERHAP2_LOCUS39404 [Linum perenne]